MATQGYNPSYPPDPEYLAYRRRLVDEARRLLADRVALTLAQEKTTEGNQSSARRDLLTWTIEAQRDENGGRGWVPARHHRFLISHLERVAAGECPRSMIFMPPGSAKSTYASRLFPAWMFQRRPRLRIIGASHTSGLALEFSADVQQLVRDNSETLGYGLLTENKQRWRTTNGGSYLASGVGYAIPGYRADLGIIDDPIKSRAAADSPVDRNHVWNWYLGSFERRLTPGAPVIIILTRWHEDDLAGRLLQTQGDKWEVVRLPAAAEDDDQLGRRPGEWLWDDDEYGFGAELKGIRDDLERAGANREWSAQYQQRPRPLEGALFMVDRIGVLPAAPTGGITVRAYDLAATRQMGTRDPAWTRGVKMTLMPNRRIVVEDVVGARGAPDEVERLIVNTAGQDGRKIRIGLPQDPGQAGKAQVAYFLKLLNRFHVDVSPETGDKATRAGPFASQVNVGNVDIVEGAWNRSFLDELASFPSGSKSDQVDASSRAYEMLLSRGRPLTMSRQQQARVARNPTQNRFAAAQRDRFARVR